MNDMKEFTRKMLNTIRKETMRESKNGPVEEHILERDNFLTHSKVLMEEVEAKIKDSKEGKVFPITKKTPQFSDVRVSQEESLRKTIGEQLKTDENSLLYYPETEDLTFNGEIPALNLSFQFRYNEPSGNGLFIWADGLQLSEENARTIGKLRDGFMNWRSGLIQDDDLFEKLKKACDKMEH